MTTKGYVTRDLIAALEERVETLERELAQHRKGGHTVTLYSFLNNAAVPPPPYETFTPSNTAAPESAYEDRWFKCKACGCWYIGEHACTLAPQPVSEGVD